MYIHVVETKKNQGNKNSNEFIMKLKNGPTFPLPMISINLPGVPTKMWVPCSTCLSWYPTDVPPYNTTALSMVPWANFRASIKIWTANSLVGATTRACGSWTSEKLLPLIPFFIIPVRTGSKKAACVRNQEITIKSSPFMYHENVLYLFIRNNFILTHYTVVSYTFAHTF